MMQKISTYLYYSKENNTSFENYFTLDDLEVKLVMVSNEKDLAKQFEKETVGCLIIDLNYFSILEVKTSLSSIDLHQDGVHLVVACQEVDNSLALMLYRENVKIQIKKPFKIEDVIQLKEEINLVKFNYANKVTKNDTKISVLKRKKTEYERNKPFEQRYELVKHVTSGYTEYIDTIFVINSPKSGTVEEKQFADISDKGKRGLNITFKNLELSIESAKKLQEVAKDSKVICWISKNVLSKGDFRKKIIKEITAEKLNDIIIIKLSVVDLLEDEEAMRRAIRDLHAAKIQVVLYDFVDNPKLEVLSKFDIDNIFLDVTYDTQPEKIVKQGVYQICKDLNINVIATNINNPTQFEYIQLLGIDYAKSKTYKNNSKTITAGLVR